VRFQQELLHQGLEAHVHAADLRLCEQAQRKISARARARTRQWQCRTEICCSAALIFRTIESSLICALRSSIIPLTRSTSSAIELSSPA
jgi:hypothetical protein